MKTEKNILERIGSIMKKNNKNFVAYSKKLCDYSRIECWIITVIYILAKLFLDKDIGEVCLASWAAYAACKSFYFIMARSDHQIQLLKEINKEDSAKELLEEKVVSDFSETINETVSEN